MTNEQQEIDDQITRIKEEWDGLKSIRGNEARLTKIMEPILYLASFLESKGHRQESIEDEIVHLLKGMTNEVTIRLTLRDTRFHPSVNLKVYDSYVKDFSSKTAYIHKDVMDKLGMTDTDDSNIIETETKSGKRTVANVLELRDVDKRRKNIIRIGGVTTMVNLF